MITTEVLNVSEIEPKLKHPTIFQHFDMLEAGEGFMIDNDHDPKPLYYQLLGERGNIFTWEYLEEGPDRWKVRIAKKNMVVGETVGELVAKDMRKAEVFKKFGIDFCCGGGKSIKEASAEAGVSEEEVQKALKEAELSTTAPAHDYNN